MDQKIYHPTRVDYGIYSTRRYPKGLAVPSGDPLPGIPPSPTDPNANPVTVQRTFGAATLAPHGSIQRLEYIVPPRRRFRLQGAFVNMLRDVTTGAPGGSSASVNFNRAGQPFTGVNDLFSLVQAWLKDGVLGAKDQMQHSGEMEFFEGDRVTGWTSDSSVGGNVSYVVSFYGIEYDETHKVLGRDSAGEFWTGEVTSNIMPFGRNPDGSPKLWPGS